MNRPANMKHARNQVACRLHAVLCELVPGGLAKEISADQANQVLAGAGPCRAVQQARHPKKRCAPSNARSATPSTGA